jgi:hypothetical protein
VNTSTFSNTLYTAKINSEQSLGAITAMEFLAPKNFAPPPQPAA